MADNPVFADTSLPIRDTFIVCGDYIIDPAKVVAVSSVHACTETMTQRFTVLLAGGHEVDLFAEPGLKVGTFTIDSDRWKKDSEKMRADFLVQWRSLTNARRNPS